MRSAVSAKRLPAHLPPERKPLRQPKLVYTRKQRFTVGVAVDRLLRSRFWIAFIGFALIGLVAMQVSLLRINAQSGAAAQKANDLARTNDELRSEVSRLASSDRIRFLAEKQGMVVLAPNQIRYLNTNAKHDAQTAAALLAKPAPQVVAPVITPGTFQPAGNPGGTPTPQATTPSSTVNVQPQTTSPTQ